MEAFDNKAIVGCLTERRNQLGSGITRTTVRGKGSHLIGTLAAVVVFCYGIQVLINNAFNDVFVALDTNYRGMFANYGVESHKPSILS